MSMQEHHEMPKPRKVKPVQSTALTEKQVRFVDEYLIDLNATQAAIRAGYSHDSARFIGYENLTKQSIADAIAAQQKERSERLGITKDQIVEEAKKSGLANMMDYVTFSEGGLIDVDLARISRDQGAAIREIEVDIWNEGKGDEKIPHRRVKLKLHDKTQNLTLLAKLGGHLIERREHEHSGPGGGPIQLDAMTVREQSRIIAMALTSGVIDQKALASVTLQNPTKMKEVVGPVTFRDSDKDSDSE